MPRNRLASCRTCSNDTANLLRRAGRFAVGIVGVGGKTEADRALVGLFGRGIELCQAGQIANDQRQDSGGQRVESAEMAHRALLQDAADAIDHVVRGQSGGLVDDEDGVHE